jgi:quinol monooxygenase YgiN
MWDRQKITQVLYRNVRSIDRLDTDLMKSTYWPDAIQDHQDPIYPIDYSGNAWEFCDFAISELAKIDRTNHRLSNVMIELNGDRAYAEAYVRAYHIAGKEGEKKEGILLGRYQNIMERRNGEWKILYRLTIFDANRSFDATEVWIDNFRNLGDRYPRDISYKVINRVSGKSKIAGPDDLVFYVNFHIKKEAVEEFKQRALGVINQMVKEDTFVSAFMHQDASDPTKFTLYERWSESSRADFMKNQLNGKDYRKAYEKSLPELVVSPREISFLNPVKAWVNPAAEPSDNDLAFYVNFYIKPEQVTKWKESAMEVINKMSAEKTFVSAFMHQDASDPCKFTLYERWNEPDMEAFMKNQLNSKAYRKAYEKKLPEMVKSPRTFSILKPVESWYRK